MDGPSVKFDIVPVQKPAATVEMLLTAPGKDFVSEPREALDLTFEGIPGDYHAGLTRRSGGREPWYQRGTEMRNERQITIVAADELAAAAAAMGVEEVKPEWIGANMVLSGVRNLSMLPSGSLIFLAGGATLKVDAQNHPCTLAGRAIAQAIGMADVKTGALLFPKHARRLRGLTAWVEKPGRVGVGEAASIRIPEQWIYRA